MLFSYNWLQSFFDKKLPEPKELECLIIKHSFEVEKIEKKAKDTVFDINILSNRPDCLAHLGIAREISAILGYKIVLAKSKTGKTKKLAATRTLVNVEIQDAAACPRYCTKMVAGVKIGPSPKWLQERLAACGIRSISNIVDATNYVMLELGQPLHAFDYARLAPGQRSKIKKIIVRRAAAGEEIAALDDKTYKLDPSMLVIADSAGPLAIAGIKGGLRAQIDDQTKDIVIEAANFDARTIRFTSRKIGLRTDASMRYEHILDPNLAETAADRVAGLIVEIASGQILSGMIDSYAKPVRPKEILLNMELAENLLGTAIQTANVKKILESLGMTVRRASGTKLEVKVPTLRRDIAIAPDLVEEIGRINGYDKIESKLPVAPVYSVPKNYFWQWKNTVRRSLKEAGYSETRNYSFISDPDRVNFNLAVDRLLEVINPVNLDLRYLRPALLINLLKNAQKNQLVEDLQQFEIGKIFETKKRDEPVMLAAIDKKNSFLQVKGILKQMFTDLGIDNLKCEPLGDNNQSLLDPNQSARILTHNREVGIIGKLSAQRAAILKIKPLLVFELNMEILLKMATEKINYKPISAHPAAIRDIAVLTPRAEYAGKIIDTIKKAGGVMVKSIDLIDVYQGAPIPEGQKNIAFRITYQSPDRTLSGDEIDSLQKGVLIALEGNNWKVRK